MCMNPHPSPPTASKPWLGEGCLSNIQMSWALSWINVPCLSKDYDNDFADHILLMFLTWKKKKSLKYGKSLFNVSIYKPKWVWALWRSLLLTASLRSSLCVPCQSLAFLPFSIAVVMLPWRSSDPMFSLAKVLLGKCLFTVDNLANCCLKQDPCGHLEISAALR